MLTGDRPGGRRIHPWQLCSLGYAQGFVRFIRGRWVHLDAVGFTRGALGAVTFIPGGLWVHWGATLGSSDSSKIVVFAGLCPSGSRVHLASGLSWVTGVRPRCRRIYPRSQGSMGSPMRFVVFIRGHLNHRGAPWWPSGSSGVAAFTGVRPGGDRIHPGSLVSLGCALVAVVFIRCRLGAL